MRKILIVVAVIVIAAAGFYALKPIDAVVPSESKTDAERLGMVGDYVKENISELSPEKEVLGGKFFVTSVSFNESLGIVNYEDGHNAYMATFTFAVDETKTVSVTDFKLLVPSGAAPEFLKRGNLVKYEGRENWS